MPVRCKAPEPRRISLVEHGSQYEKGRIPCCSDNVGLAKRNLYQGAMSSQMKTFVVMASAVGNGEMMFRRLEVAVPISVAAQVECFCTIHDESRLRKRMLVESQCRPTAAQPTCGW